MVTGFGTPAYKMILQCNLFHPHYFLPLIVNISSVLKFASQLKLNADSKPSNHIKSLQIFFFYPPQTTLGWHAFEQTKSDFSLLIFRAFGQMWSEKFIPFSSSVGSFFPNSSPPSGSLEVLESRKVLVHCTEIQKRLLNCERKFAFQRHWKSQSPTLLQQQRENICIFCPLCLSAVTEWKTLYLLSVPFIPP